MKICELRQLYEIKGNVGLRDGDILSSMAKTIESDRRTIINYDNVQREIEPLTHL